MLNQIKSYFEKHEEQYELVRYVIAGGLTTVLSMLISYTGCFLLAPKEAMTGSVIRWIIDTINLASVNQVMISNAASWIIAVLFAFWINRRMVFRVRGGTRANLWLALGEFALGRVASFILFEEGLAALLKLIGVTNVVNRVIVLLFVMVFNYIISKFWVFKKANVTGDKPRE